MGVLLLILKIIGITLLVILGLVLLILILVLVVPFRYSANGRKQESFIEGSAKVTWLLHFIAVSLNYDGNEKKPEFDIRIAGISPLKIKKKLSEKKKAKKKAEKKKQLEKIKEENPEKYETLKAEALERKKAREEEEAARLEAEKARLEAEAETPILPEEGGEAEKTPDAHDKYGAVKSKLIQLISLVLDLLRKLLAKLLILLISAYQIPFDVADRINRGFTKFSDKVVRICGKIDKVTRFIGDYRTGAFLRLVFGDLKKILRHVLPRKLDGDVELGLEDPSTTGLITAAYSAAYPVHSGNLRLKTDFEEQKMNGNLDIKGHIKLGYLAFVAVSLVLNKNTRYILKFIKSLKED